MSNGVKTIVEGLRDPFQAKYHHGDLYNDAADKLEELESSSDMEEFIDKLQMKLPEVSDFDNLVDEVDALSEEDDIDALKEKLLSVSQRIGKLGTEQEKAHNFIKGVGDDV